MKAYDNVDQLRQSLKKYFHFYNMKRPHQSFDGSTSDEIQAVAASEDKTDKAISVAQDEPLKMAVS